MSQLSKLTLVTPTYNRQRFALRSMRFWSGSDVHLLVMDGSSQPISQEHLASLADNIRYVWMPVSLEERLRATTELVDTEFVALLADDEFFLVSALEACIKHLDNNSDTVASIGRCANFWPSKYQLKANQRYPMWQSLTMDDPQDRILALASKYQPSTCYAVTRRQQWVLCHQVASTTRFSTPYTIEMQLEFMMTYLGKVMVLDELMWLRSGENHPVHVPGWSRQLEFHQWYKDNRFKGEIDEFIRIMSEKLAPVFSSSDEREIRTNLGNATEAYVSSCSDPKGIVNDVRIFWMSVLHSIAAALPRNIKYPIKKVLGLSQGQVDMQDLPAYFQQRGVGVNTKDLSQIIETLRSFYA